MPSPTCIAARVPASTSNLGPGFDLLGLSLSLFVDVEVEVLGEGRAHERRTMDGHARAWPEPGACRFFRAFDHARRELGARPIGVALSARSEIPLGRGLGSSGAAAAAGLVVAAALAPEPPARATLVEWGLALEGHPDNSTASLVGGCTLALPHARGVRVIEQPVHSSIAVAVAWPATPLATSAAREVLPREVPFRDAVENPRRLAMLLEGLRTGEPELLRLGEEDRLHARFRLPRIAGGERALAAAREAGAWLATVSGSGSGLVALGAHEHAAAIADAMRAALDSASGAAEGRVVHVVREPPSVRMHAS